jgi:hypothetical protein
MIIVGSTAPMDPALSLPISRQIIFLGWVVNPMPTRNIPGGSMFFGQGFLP